MKIYLCLLVLLVQKLENSYSQIFFIVIVTKYRASQKEPGSHDIRDLSVLKCVYIDQSVDFLM